MDTVLKDIIGDVVVFSRTAEEHASRLEHVLERFDRANLQLHL